MQKTRGFGQFQEYKNGDEVRDQTGNIQLIIPTELPIDVSNKNVTNSKDSLLWPIVPDRR